MVVVSARLFLGSFRVTTRDLGTLQPRFAVSESQIVSRTLMPIGRAVQLVRTVHHLRRPAGSDQTRSDPGSSGSSSTEDYGPDPVGPSTAPGRAAHGRTHSEPQVRSGWSSRRELGPVSGRASGRCGPPGALGAGAVTMLGCHRGLAATGGAPSQGAHLSALCHANDAHQCALSPCQTVRGAVQALRVLLRARSLAPLELLRRLSLKAGFVERAVRAPWRLRRARLKRRPGFVFTSQCYQGIILCRPYYYVRSYSCPTPPLLFPTRRRCCHGAGWRQDSIKGSAGWRQDSIKGSETST